MLNLSCEILPNPELVELYQIAKKEVYAELERPEPVRLSDDERKRLPENLPPCLSCIISENPDIQRENTYNRLSMILCSYFKFAGIDEATAFKQGDNFIEHYPYSKTYDTPQKRREAFKGTWDYVQKTENYNFQCSYVLGLGLSGFDCSECLLKNEARPETNIRGDDVLKYLYSNEDGDAQIYIKVNEGLFLYDCAAGLWYKWVKHFWTEDLLGEATEAIGAVIDVYAKEAKRQSWLRLKATKENKPEDAEKHKKYEDSLLKRIAALQTINRKQNVLQLARTGQNSLAITGAEWDREPKCLGCPNGVIEVKDGSFRDGRPGDFIKTISPIQWRGLNEPAPAWERFLGEIFNVDFSIVSYIQRLFGYGISGLNVEHVVIFFWGIGANGKTTILEILKFVLGGLAHKIEAELLLDQTFQKNAGSPNSGILSLRGKRIVWASETSEGRRLNAGRLKELVGADTLNARAVYGKRHIEFIPSHLLILLTNNKPHAPANDYALWQRIHLIPFGLSFVDRPEKSHERKADKRLAEKLKAEAPGILAWLVRGFLEYQKHGLNPPEAVLSATEQYRKDEDFIQHFIDERCIVRDNTEVRAGELYQAYKAWCDENGQKAFSGIRFGKEMRTRFDYEDSRRHIYYLGIGLKNE